VRKRWSIRNFSRAWCGCTSCTTRPLPDAARARTQGLFSLTNGTCRPLAAPRLPSDSYGVEAVGMAREKVRELVRESWRLRPGPRIGATSRQAPRPTIERPVAS